MLSCYHVIATHVQALVQDRRPTASPGRIVGLSNAKDRDLGAWDARSPTIRLNIAGMLRQRLAADEEMERKSEEERAARAATAARRLAQCRGSRCLSMRASRACLSLLRRTLALHVVQGTALDPVPNLRSSTVVLH